MNRQQALRQADLWRIGHLTQLRGEDHIETHESINKAKAYSRSKGRAVALQKAERGHGDQVFGFFNYGQP